MSDTTEQTDQQEQSAPPAPAQAGPKPPWGSDSEFNPERAWQLLQNVRADLTDTKASLEAARKEAAEVEGLRLAVQEAKDVATETELSLHRERAARAHGLTDEQVEFLAELTDPDAIQSRAERLAAMTAKASPAVDPTQGSTATGTGEQSTADLFAAAIEGGFTR